MGSSFQDLAAWKKSIDLVVSIYRATRSFPPEENYGLRNQVRRAAVSVPSNIAEGQGRLTPPEFIRFLGISRGSLQEVETQVVIAQKLDYITEKQLHVLRTDIHEVGRIINGLITAIEREAWKDKDNQLPEDQAQEKALGATPAAGDSLKPPGPIRDCSSSAARPDASGKR